MFTARFHIGSVRPLPVLTRPAGLSTGAALQAGGILRIAALLAFLAPGLPGMSSAQALGTMQVTARVTPASVAWTGLVEAGAAARSAAWEKSGRPLIRRSGLIQTLAEIHPSGGRRLLLVTIQHPYN